MVGGLDIPYFRKLHSDVCDKLVPLCEKWEYKAALVEQENIPNVEEGRL